MRSRPRSRRADPRSVTRPDPPPGDARSGPCGSVGSCLRLRDALPLHARLGRGRHQKDDLLRTAISTVMERTGGLGWLVVDRGMDDARFIHAMKRDGRTAVIRIKDMRRDVFGNGRGVDATLADLDFGKAHLNTYRGAMRAEVRCAVGVMQYCAHPHSKDAPVHRSELLVVESRFGGKSIYLYVVCPDAVIDDPSLARPGFQKSQISFWRV